MNAVEFQSVSKSYAIYESPSDRLKELLTFNRLKRHRDFWALRDVSFEVRRGETFCIVGENGSGKSTLLQMVAGILQPSTGEAVTSTAASRRCWNWAPASTRNSAGATTSTSTAPSWA